MARDETHLLLAPAQRRHDMTIVIATQNREVGGKSFGAEETFQHADKSEQGNLMII